VVKIKIELEKIILMIFFVSVLYLGPGMLFDHSISHDFPYAYGASDSFQHQTRAEAIKDLGNKFDAPYIVKGNTDFVLIYPPILYQLAIIISYASGLETYDSIYFAVTFFAVIASLVMYFVIRNFNKTVAILSLPLSLLIFSSPVSTGFLWGHWPSIIAQPFLVLIFWAILRINLRYSFILIAIAISGTALAHTSSTIFAFIFLAMVFGLKMILRKLTIEEFKSMALAMITFIMISFYYLIIFINTWAVKQPYEFSILPVWDGNPGFYIAGFGLLLVPMAIGIIFSIVKIKTSHVVIIASLAMLIGGFMNYAGFQVRSFQMRFFWPIYLSVLVGLGIYVVLKLVIKKWTIIHTSILFIILLVMISGVVNFPIIKQTNIQVIPSIPQLNQGTSPGLMNPFHWQGLTWFNDNTPKNATVYFFYGDIYGQDAVLRNTKRLHQQVDPREFVAALQERKIKKEYVSEVPGDSAGSFYRRHSFFDFTTPDKVPGLYFGPRNICNFDYLVFDKVSRQQVLAQYNLIIASELLQKDYIGIVFENEVLVVLKNNNVGVDCIEERNF
jgi:hypothetical protein